MGTLLHPSPQRKQGNTAGVTGWDERRHRFDVFVSQLVFEEASAGDPKAAAERVKLLEGLRFIRSIREKMLAECGGKPEEFFRRLREGERLPGIYATLRSEGLSPPLIVTPEEFSNAE